MLLQVLTALAAGCVPVDTDHILARQLGDRVTAFAALPPETEIALAPSPGSRRTLGGAELHRLALRHGVEFSGIGGACFERSAEPLAKDRVETALREVWQSGKDSDPQATFEILDYSRAPVPRGDLEFLPAGLGPPQPGGEVLWRGRVRYGPGRSVPVWARVRILSLQQRVVAVRDLAARKVIGESDVRIEERRGPPVSPGSTDRIDDVIGRIPRRTLHAGQPVDPRLLSEAPAVERGAFVAVEVRSGGAHLGFRGKAESGGRPGDWIVVKNPVSLKRFRARVEGKGLVVVETGEIGRQDEVADSRCGAGGAAAGDGGESENRKGPPARPLHSGGIGLEDGGGH